MAAWQGNYMKHSEIYRATAMLFRHVGWKLLYNRQRNLWFERWGFLASPPPPLFFLTLQTGIQLPQQLSKVKQKHSLYLLSSIYFFCPVNIK